MNAVDKLLGAMPKLGASDLHLSPGQPPLFRINGDIKRANGNPLDSDLIKKFMLDIMPPRKRKRFDDTMDIDMNYSVPDLGRFRVNVLMQERGMGAVFRMIPNDIITPEELGLPPSVPRLAALKSGLVVVTGPTGSGKSTTLATMIDLINRTRCLHIITIEDPIEFLHQSKKSLVTQRQVEDHTSSFPIALRAALREDPDVILVGEMRDTETIRMAITAAETGHLVLATLHTSSASNAVDRIIDAFPTGEKDVIRVMLSESLKAVIAQVLLKRADGDGRVAAFEVLLGSPALSNLIRESKTFQIPSHIQTSRSHGMQLLEQSLMDLVKQRKVNPEEAREFAGTNIQKTALTFKGHMA